jgi:hypothetical protein
MISEIASPGPERSTLRDGPLHWLALATILLIAAVLRLRGLGVESLWGDEALSLQIARLDLFEALKRVIDWEQIPPLHHVLLHFWIRVFGVSETSLRMPSALAGIVAVAMIYVLVRQLGSRRIALPAAALLAVSPIHLAYSQECRTYALYVLLALISCSLFVRLISRPARPRLHAAYVIISALVLYSHIYGIYTLAAQHLTYVVLYWQQRRGRGEGVAIGPRQWITDNIAIAALYSPWVKIVIHWTRMVSISFWVKQATFDDIPRTYWVFAGSLPVLFVMVALVVFGLARYRREMRGLLLPLSLMLVPVVVPATISVLTRPSYAPRYAIFACVGLSIVAGAGVAALPGRVLPALVVGLLMFATPRGDAAAIPRDRWRDLGLFLTKTMRAGDLALAHPAAEKRVYDYYVYRPDVRRTGIDPPRLPVAFPMENDRHLWLIYVYEPWFTVNQFLEGEPVKIGRRMRINKVLALELVNAPGGERFGRYPTTAPATTAPATTESTMTEPATASSQPSAASPVRIPSP